MQNPDTRVNTGSEPRKIVDYISRQTKGGKVVMIPIYEDDRLINTSANAPYEAPVMAEPIEEVSLGTPIVNYIWYGMAFAVVGVGTALVGPPIVEWFAGRMAITADAMGRMSQDFVIVLGGLALLLGPPAVFVSWLKWKLSRPKGDPPGKPRLERLGHDRPTHPATSQAGTTNYFINNVNLPSND